MFFFCSFSSNCELWKAAFYEWSNSACSARQCAVRRLRIICKFHTFWADWIGIYCFLFLFFWLIVLELRLLVSISFKFYRGFFDNCSNIFWRLKSKYINSSDFGCHPTHYHCQHSNKQNMKYMSISSPICSTNRLKHQAIKKKNKPHQF